MLHELGYSIHKSDKTRKSILRKAALNHGRKEVLKRLWKAKILHTGKPAYEIFSRDVKAVEGFKRIPE